MYINNIPTNVHIYAHICIFYRQKILPPPNGMHYESRTHTHTHTRTHKYVYITAKRSFNRQIASIMKVKSTAPNTVVHIYICVCMCVYVQNDK